MGREPSDTGGKRFRTSLLERAARETKADPAYMPARQLECCTAVAYTIGPGSMPGGLARVVFTLP